MILLASLGGALELYDFLVFGVFASAIGAAFFPMPTPWSRGCLPTFVLPLAISRDRSATSSLSISVIA
jgi:hypothetical protein